MSAVEKRAALDAAKADAAAQLRMLFRTSEVSDVYRALADFADRYPANVLAAALLVLLADALKRLPPSPSPAFLDAEVFACEYLLESKTPIGHDALIGFCRAARLDVVTPSGDHQRTH